MAEPGAPPAGWLLDPDDPTLLRWWDGRAWGEFRRQREPNRPPAAPATPAPAPPAAPPAPAAPPDPAPPAVTAVAWSPDRPDVGVPLAAPRATAPEPSVPRATPPRTTVTDPEPFTSQWDRHVAAVLASLADDTRRRRAAVFAGVRAQVLAETEVDEEVFEAFPVTIHDEHRSGARLGATRIGADLLVSDRRLLLVVDQPRWEDALVTVTLDDVLVVTGVSGGGVVLDLAGEGPPLLLRAAESGRRGFLLDLLLSLVADAPDTAHRSPDLVGDFGVEVAPFAGRRARGVEVLAVGHGSLAAQLGITPGDHLSAIDGAEVRSARDLALVFATYATGEEVTVVWSSGSRFFEASVVL